LRLSAVRAPSRSNNLALEIDKSQKNACLQSQYATNGYIALQNHAALAKELVTRRGICFGEGSRLPPGGG
jgi:hypothetical protein